MKKLLTLLLVAAMVLSLSVLASAVNCPTNEDVGYENSGYFFAQDARETTITIDGFKDDVFGDTPSFSYKSTGNATEDNVGNFTETKNWVYIGGGTWEDMQSIINPSNYVEGYFAWDTDYLYFFIHQDLGAFKQGQPANLMWQDYCIQIEFIDFKARTFSDWGCSVSQSTGETLQYCFVNGGCTCPEGATNYNVKVTADDSYVAYEGAIPVDDFFAKSAIEEGSTLGFNLCINFGDISQQGKQKCLTWAADNYHARSGDSAIPITLLGPSTTMEDALNAQAEAERMIKDAAEETDGKGVLFNGCNNTDGISGVTLTRETVKSGSGAWAFTLGEHNFRFTRDPVNASDFDSLEFDLYIGDDSVVSAMRSDNGCVELTSSGAPDQNEIAWNMSQILDGIEGGAKAGWNHVVLYFKDAGKTGGDIDLSAVNFFRFFDITNTNKTEGVIDNIRLTSALAEKEKKESESLAKWERQSRQAYERESLQKAREESESLHQAELASLEAASKAAAEESKNTAAETEPKSNNETKKSGCGSVIAAGTILLVATGIAGTALVIKRKEH